MKAKTKTLETVEQLVEYALSMSSYNSGQRWKLEDWSRQEYVDLEAGNAWQDEHNKIKWVSFGQPGHEEYQQIRQESYSRMPAQRDKITWTLVASGHSYSPDRIYLSEELGKAVDGIWTKKVTSTWSSTPQRVGVMTLNGILKRLGKTDIGKQVKKIQAEAKAKAEKASRNRVRKEARRLATELLDLIENHPFAGNVVAVDGLKGIANLMKDEA